jgi:hypothetical protein
MVSRDCRDHGGQKARPDHEARKVHRDRRGQKAHRAEMESTVRTVRRVSKVRRGQPDRRGHKECGDSTVKMHRSRLRMNGTFTSSATRRDSSKTFKPFQFVSAIRVL